MGYVCNNSGGSWGKWDGGEGLMRLRLCALPVAVTEVEEEGEAGGVGSEFELVADVGGAEPEPEAAVEGTDTAESSAEWRATDCAANCKNVRDTSGGESLSAAEVDSREGRARAGGGGGEALGACDGSSNDESSCANASEGIEAIYPPLSFGASLPAAEAEAETEAAAVSAPPLYCDSNSLSGRIVISSLIALEPELVVGGAEAEAEADAEVVECTE
jgi:hypothetical protein